MKKEELAEIYSCGKSSNPIFKQAHKDDFIAGFNKCLEINAIKHFIPPHTAQEEADRVWMEYGGDIESIGAVDYAIKALKSANVDATWHKEVLTILKNK
jgi:hypothetical protein